MPDCIDEFANNIDKFGKNTTWSSIENCYEVKLWLSDDLPTTYWTFLNGVYYQELWHQLEHSTTERIMEKCANDYEKTVIDYIDTLSSPLDACVVNNTLAKRSNTAGFIRFAWTNVFEPKNSSDNFFFQLYMPWKIAKFTIQSINKIHRAVIFDKKNLTCNINVLKQTYSHSNNQVVAHAYISSHNLFPYIGMWTYILNITIIIFSYHRWRRKCQK